jgi:hypothetical protein
MKAVISQHVRDQRWFASITWVALPKAEGLRLGGGK